MMFEAFGVKSSTAIAGFFGSITALAHLRPTSVWQGAAVILSGLTGAVYWTPLASHYFGLPEVAEYGAAFTLGIMSMAIVSGLLSLADSIRKDPLSVLSRFRGGGK